MKVFNLIQKNYAVVGIITPTGRNAFNNRILLGFFLFGLIFVSQVVLFLYVSDGLTEYMESGCSLSATILLFVCFSANIFKNSTLFECIHNIERLIDTSKLFFDPFEHEKIHSKTEKPFISGCKYAKSKQFFLKTNRQVERLSEIVITLIVKIVVQIMMLPKAIISFATYFATGSGSESFEIPYPMW